MEVRQTSSRRSLVQESPVGSWGGGLDGRVGGVCAREKAEKGKEEGEQHTAAEGDIHHVVRGE